MDDANAEGVRRRLIQNEKLDAVLKELKDFTMSETAFVQGTLGNVKKFGRDFAVEWLGVRGASAAEVREDNAEHVVADKLALAGLDAAVFGEFPSDREAWVVLRSGIRRNPVMIAGIKSFAGSQAAGMLSGNSTMDMSGHLIEFLGSLDEKLARLDKSLLSRPTPLVLTLFAPAGWQHAVPKDMALGRNSRTFLWGPNKDPARALWCSCEHGELDWSAWLALTPMTEQSRRAWAIDRLDTYARLTMLHDAVTIEDAASSLELPVALTVRLLQSAAGEGVFRVGPEHGEPQFVQRMKAR